MMGGMLAGGMLAGGMLAGGMPSGGMLCMEMGTSAWVPRVSSPVWNVPAEPASEKRGGSLAMASMFFLGRLVFDVQTPPHLHNAGEPPSRI